MANTFLGFRWVCFSAASLAAVVAACSNGAPASNEPSDAGDDVNTIDAGGPGEMAIDGLSSEWLAKFAAAQAAFARPFEDTDGLGPLYTKKSCADCHDQGSRGPGFVTKMAAVEEDGLTPVADQSAFLPYGNTEHPFVVTAIPGVHTPVLSPFDGGVDGGIDAGTISIRVTKRVGPPVFGRGYLEAIADTEIERMESMQSTRSDGIHGHINHITFISQPDPDPTFDKSKPGNIVIGRFGLKARIATLDEFAADALQGDIGITSPMRTTEIANPDGVSDDLKPGIDVTADEMTARGMYGRLLAIPPRIPNIVGQGWFESCSCNVCHAETLHTRADYPIPQLANIDAPVFTDMLLHDMGDTLSDSVVGGNEGEAGPRDWRTLPLIGLRFNTSFMHDGRATTIAEAILEHDGPGSEAANSIGCYESLNPSVQQLIVDFVSGL